MPTFSESSADRASMKFHVLLSWHYDRGTRPDSRVGLSGKSWTAKELAGACGTAEEGQRAVSNWLTGANRPNSTYYEKIEQAFFGQNPDYEAAKLQLRAAWTRERGRRRVEAPSTTEPAPEKVGAVGRDNPPPTEQSEPQIQLKLDDKGRTVETAWFGANGQPVLNSDGIARIAWRFDDDDRTTEESYFGVDGLPSLGSKLAARVTWKRDNDGRVIEVAFFGIDGLLTLNSEHVARITWDIDDNGRVTEQAYFGTDGRLVVGPDGTARVVWKYRADGSVLEVTNFGVGDY